MPRDRWRGQDLERDSEYDPTSFSLENRGKYHIMLHWPQKVEYAWKAAQIHTRNAILGQLHRLPIRPTIDRVTYYTILHSVYACSEANT